MGLSKIGGSLPIHENLSADAGIDGSLSIDSIPSEVRLPPGQIKLPAAHFANGRDNAIRQQMKYRFRGALLLAEESE